MHDADDMDSFAGDPENHPIIAFNEMAIGSVPSGILGYGRTFLREPFQCLDVFFKALDEVRGGHA